MSRIIISFTTRASLEEKFERCHCYELQKLADVPTYYVSDGYQTPDTRTYEYILILFDEFSKVLQLIKCMAKYYDEFFQG